MSISVKSGAKAGRRRGAGAATECSGENVGCRARIGGWLVGVEDKKETSDALANRKHIRQCSRKCLTEQVELVRELPGK